ncbi:hypothetical protein LIER_42000 [Lithospermum erythrorhizon]|uniref:Uncharacterized protein n=1 Tax=Lithospermum erythrorhizon TaxID=34254 RepID=A0AAV3RNQ6_LITER
MLMSNASILNPNPSRTRPCLCIAPYNFLPLPKRRNLNKFPPSELRQEEMNHLSYYSEMAGPTPMTQHVSCLDLGRSLLSKSAPLSSV